MDCFVCLFDCLLCRRLVTLLNGFSFVLAFVRSVIVIVIWVYIVFFDCCLLFG